MTLPDLPWAWFMIWHDRWRLLRLLYTLHVLVYRKETEVAVVSMYEEQRRSNEKCMYSRWIYEYWFICLLDKYFKVGEPKHIEQECTYKKVVARRCCWLRKRSRWHVTARMTVFLWRLAILLCFERNEATRRRLQGARLGNPSQALGFKWATSLLLERRGQWPPGPATSQLAGSACHLSHETGVGDGWPKRPRLPAHLRETDIRCCIVAALQDLSRFHLTALSKIDVSRCK